MMPLTELTGIPKTKAAKVELKARVYYRGAVPTTPNQQPIPKQIIAQEEARGFITQGLFRKRVRHFVDGFDINDTRHPSSGMLLFLIPMTL